MARTLYVKFNSTGAGTTTKSNSLPSLARHVLLSLFSNIGNDTLLFLAGVWSSNEASPKNIEESSASVAALHHARAFILAHNSEDEKDKPLDFQVIIPAVLIALQSSDKTVREAAVLVIDAISSRTSTLKSKKVEVYAFDRIYAQSGKPE